ncbi:hypothetical protein P691DRAFT_771005 [Macrolepiota fuliginosa MF-IS2]|uniref:C2H2-type domain-containing protein n=1 Tax=Macrolepiota fuliginosa MF-IS2 TaxID=1400762 RepID=A0A9P5XNV0_9AGAR|nr:hypothetical protein P691DRAFT_771005 [Macrolepiota fuliginosa MF-IS2]
MSNPSDGTGPGKRVTLPPIRDLFRDELMHSPPHDPPSTTPTRLRMSDDVNDVSSFSSSMSRGPPSRMYRPVSEHPSPSFQSPALNRGNFLPSTPPYHDNYQRSGPSPTSTSQSHLSTPQRLDVQPSHPPSDSPVFRSRSHLPFQSSDRLQNRPTGPTSNQQPRPVHMQSSYVEPREPVQYNNLVQMPRLPTPPNPARTAQAHSLDSPPALVRAVAPWVIATNMDMGQIYEDEERTPISRPFDASSMAHSYTIPLGRCVEEGSQPPLGKYDCKFCGKLFNRPSSLRIHLNSHTGEKPFVCPHADCGRSFSVLSNMRRHARVHMNSPKEQDLEESNDETSRQSSPTPPPMPGPSTVTLEIVPTQSSHRSPIHSRQDNNPSDSSSVSMRSRSRSPEDVRMERVERP